MERDTAGVVATGVVNDVLLFPADEGNVAVDEKGLVSLVMFSEVEGLWAVDELADELLGSEVSVSAPVEVTGLSTVSVLVEFTG